MKADNTLSKLALSNEFGQLTSGACLALAGGTGTTGNGGNTSGGSSSGGTGTGSGSGYEGHIDEEGPGEIDK